MCIRDRFHPPQSVNGLPPENTFYVADSANMTVADGFLIPTYHPYLFPDRPINLFMSIRSKGPGRDMLMGCLLYTSGLEHRACHRGPSGRKDAP